MPQMSPMNWMFISSAFLVMILLTTASMKSNQNEKHFKKTTNKNILWKW